MYSVDGKTSYYWNNLEKSKATQKIYRDTHKQETSARSKAYYEANKDKAILASKIRQKEKADLVNAKHREWRENNKEKVREYSAKAYISAKSNNPDSLRIKSQRRIAAASSAPGDGLTLQQWEFIKKEYGYRCAYCNKQGDLTIDHIVPISDGGAHDAGNIAPACPNCNYSKGAKSLLLFMNYRMMSC